MARPKDTRKLTLAKPEIFPTDLIYNDETLITLKTVAGARIVYMLTPRDTDWIDYTEPLHGIGCDMTVHATALKGGETSEEALRDYKYTHGGGGSSDHKVLGSAKDTQAGYLDAKVDGNTIIVGEDNKLNVPHTDITWGDIQNKPTILEPIKNLTDDLDSRAKTVDVNAAVKVLSDGINTVDGKCLALDTNKADKSTTYSKTDVDNLLTPKTDKTYVDGELLKKAALNVCDDNISVDETTMIKETLANGKIKLSAKIGGSGAVKSVNNQIPDVKGDVKLKAEHITAGAKTVQSFLDDNAAAINTLSASKEDVANKTQTIALTHYDLLGADDDKKYPSVVAVKNYVTSSVSATVEAVHTWVTQQLQAYASKAYVDDALSKKAEKDASYLKTETYTQNEINTKLATKVDEANFNDRIKGIVNSMELSASKIKDIPIDIAGLKDGQGIGYSDSLKKWIPVDIGGGGDGKFQFYKITRKMKYGEAITFNSKDIPALKNGNFLIYAIEEEYPDMSQYCTSIGGAACEPSTQSYQWIYDYMDGSDVVKEIKVTKLTGAADVAYNVTLFVLVYLGKATDLPVKTMQAMAPLGAHPVAHVKGVASIIDENSFHEWGSIYRNGNDVDILQAASIPNEWRKSKPVPGTVTINKDREIVYTGHPGFVKGKPVLRMAYTNCTGSELQSGKSYFVNISIGYASRTNGKKVGDVTVKQYSDYINWSGRPDEPGDFSMMFGEIIDCRDMIGVLTVKLAIVPIKGTNETMDLTSVKLLWMPVIEREL